MPKSFPVQSTMEPQYLDICLKGGVDYLIELKESDFSATWNQLFESLFYQGNNCNIIQCLGNSCQKVTMRHCIGFWLPEYLPLSSDWGMDFLCSNKLPSLVLCTQYSLEWLNVSPQCSLFCLNTAALMGTSSYCNKAHDELCWWIFWKISL